MQKQKNIFRIGVNNGWFLSVLGVAIFGVLGCFGVADVSAVASTLNMSVSTNTISLNVFPDSNSGTFASSNVASISVSTDHYSGYTLGIRANTSGDDSTKLVNGANKIDSISAALSEADFKNSANTQYNGKWGYKPSKLNSNSNSNYLPAPTTVGTTLDVTSGANSTANNYTLNLGVRVAPNTPTGTYSNTFVITAVANMLSYSVTYNKNTTAAVSGLPAVDSGSTTTEYVVLTSDTPTRSGYDFVGWCDSNSSETSCSTNLYTAGSNYEIDQTSSNNVTLYAIWEVGCPANNICYKANGNDVVGEMGNESASSNTELTLYASNFSRDDYGFAGWSTEPLDLSGMDFDYVLASAVSAGKVYGPNANYTPGNISTSGQKMYAIWMPVTYGTNRHGVTMELTFQDSGLFDYDIEDSDDPQTKLDDKPVGYVAALRDERDGQVYAVAKLADGKYWMIENLRLADKDSSNNNIDLDSTNTHNPSTPLTNTWWFSTNNDNDTIPTSNHLSATTDPTSTAWCSANSSNCDDQSMLTTNNTTLFTSNTASNYDASGNVYSYGNYYNWYSATAGNGKYGSSYGSSYTASGDICPAGWRLPTGKNASGDFGALDIALGGTGAYSNSDTTPTGAVMSSAYRSYPNNFVYSGYTGSSFSFRNSYGYYWTASGYNSGYAYIMDFNNSFAQPGFNNGGFNGGSVYKNAGRTVRCVAGA